ncbi:hypothetical protein JX265_010001 [Neoarthrinium moseri]|uniref:Uncharacterized protein n=1 Tax=Neoarthrinium moseri TaxID=1658444 RepID=A0A9P9WF00_9PEZI|nr:hypothetical protein JX265_010001 [Neoarthrinium moseri]
MAMPFSQFFREQWQELPIIPPKETCSGATHIITGANTRLGLEAARQLTAIGASRVILAARNLEPVVEVRPPDLNIHDSVKASAKQATDRLDRIDALIENAGAAYDRYTLAEDHEASATINVLSTFLLAVLLLPKLKESAKRFLSYHILSSSPAGPAG